MDGWMDKGERERGVGSRSLSRLFGSLTWGRYFVVKRL